MTSRTAIHGRAPALAAIVGVMTVTMAWAVRPFATPSVGPDAAAPVIHFQHLVRLAAIEGELTQTAKPLLTVLYGPLEAVAGWTGVAWATILAAALAVALAALLAQRLAGPVAAGFVTLAFVFSPILLREVALAYAVPWTACALLGAGLVATGARPRWAVVGVLLAGAALARPEALAVTGVACGGLLAASALARVRGRAGPPRRASLVCLGFAAIPVFVVHDSIVMADPLFWLGTARENSEVSGTVRDLPGMVEYVTLHVLGFLPLLPAAAVAAAVLVGRAQWAALIGLAGATLGIAAFFVVVGAGGTSIPTRYFGLMDMALVFAAGIGIGAVDVPALRRRLRPRERWNVATVVLAAGLSGSLVAAAIAPNWLVDRDHLRNAREQVRLHVNQATAMTAIRAAVEGPPDGAPAIVLILVPPRLRVQSVVDLEWPLTAVDRVWPVLVEAPSMQVEPGTIVYHDRLDDAADPAWRSIEIDQPRVVGDLRLVPLLADPGRGMWVVRVDPA